MPVTNFVQTGAANRIYVMALDLKKSNLDLRALIGWVSSSAAPESITFRTAIYTQAGRGLSFDQTLANSLLQGIPPLDLVPKTEGQVRVTTISGSEQIAQVVLGAPVLLAGSRNRYFLAVTSENANASWAAPGLLAAGPEVLACIETYGNPGWPPTVHRSATIAGLNYVPVYQLLSEVGAVHLI